MNHAKRATNWFTVTLAFALLCLTFWVQAAPERVAKSLSSTSPQSPLQLQSVALQTDILLDVAETKVELVFNNPLATSLDANFAFPLVSGQILRSALVDGIEQLTAGPLAIKGKPGQAYMIALTATPARGKRVAKLIFGQNLSKNGTHWQLPMDLSYASQAQQSQFTLTAHNQRHQPKLKLGQQSIPFTHVGQDFRLRLDNPSLDTSAWLEVSIPMTGIDEKRMEITALQDAKAKPPAQPAPPIEAVRPVSPMIAPAEVVVSGTRTKAALTYTDITAQAMAAARTSSASNYALFQKQAQLQIHENTPERDTAKYQEYKENPWKRVSDEPVSTFSADVDTGSYANVRRFLQQGRLPAHDAVRAEEMLNYFSYDYPAPKEIAAHPFSIHTQTVTSPWNPERLLMRVAIKGKDLAKQTLPPANLVFLVDVSGSMSSQERLPLVKSALKLLTEQLRSKDTVSLVTYASGTRIVLPPTSGDQKDKILLAIDQLFASGSTNGEAGIRLAYAQAHAAKIAGGINRVLLATDGDLNVGLTNNNDQTALVESERKAGISLSTLGVGDTNYNEALMKKLADHGDGSYHYLDSLQEAHKVLVNEFTSTLSVIAKDLKLQVEFNPANVDEYRLIGYELRALSREQFNDDKVDAGDIGAGHSVTALYEIVPHGSKGNVDPLRYPATTGNLADLINSNRNGELAWLKLRYKANEATQSTLVEVAIDVPKKARKIADADPDFRFATAVAAWAQWLRGSALIGDYSPTQILALANSARGEDRFGHRAEFIRLVELAKSLKRPEETSLGSD